MTQARGDVGIIGAGRFGAYYAGQLERAGYRVHRADVTDAADVRALNVARAGTDLTERMQLRGSRRPKESIPGVGPDAHHAGEARLLVPKLDRAEYATQVAAERPDRCPRVGPGFHGNDEKDRGAGEWRVYRLGDDEWLHGGISPGCLAEQRVQSLAI